MTWVSGGILASGALFDAATLHQDGELGLAIPAIGRPDEPLTEIPDRCPPGERSSPDPCHVRHVAGICQ